MFLESQDEDEHIKSDSTWIYWNYIMSSIRVFSLFLTDCRGLSMPVPHYLNLFNKLSIPAAKNTESSGVV